MLACNCKGTCKIGKVHCTYMECMRSTEMAAMYNALYLQGSTCSRRGTYCVQQRNIKYRVLPRRVPWPPRLISLRPSALTGGGAVPTPRVSRVHEIQALYETYIQSYMDVHSVTHGRTFTRTCVRAGFPRLVGQRNGQSAG